MGLEAGSHKVSHECFATPVTEIKQTNDKSNNRNIPLVPIYTRTKLVTATLED